MINITQLLKEAINGNKESEKKLQSIGQGLYLMVFKPTQSIYEYRKNGKKHIIKAGTTVLKPGKCEGGIYKRTSDYNAVWKYESNDQPAFFDNVQIYLICDVTKTTNHYVRSLEHNYISIVKDVIKTSKHEKSAGSEWMLSLEEVTDNKINEIYQTLQEEILYDSLNESRSKRYNLTKK